MGFVTKGILKAILQSTYPLDPKLKHHLILALGLAVWIFLFLYLTEPLDVNEFAAKEKLIYLPLYGTLGAIVYLFTLPFQGYIISRSSTWTLGKELLWFGAFCILAFLAVRGFYLYGVMEGHPNSYGLGYFTTHIFLPASLTILPIVLLSRWAFGKYHSKQLDKQKITIPGEGKMEGLRLHWEHIVYLQSADNYVEVYYLDGNTLKTQLLRNTLSNIAGQIPDLLRTHRSYLINPLHFQTWATTSGKALLQLSHGETVPVSKSYLPSVKNALQFTPNP